MDKMMADMVDALVGNTDTDDTNVIDDTYDPPGLSRPPGLSGLSGPPACTPPASPCGVRVHGVQGGQGVWTDVVRRSKPAGPAGPGPNQPSRSAARVTPSQPSQPSQPILAHVTVDATGLSQVLEKRAVVKITNWNEHNFGFGEVVAGSLKGQKVFLHIKRVVDNDGVRVAQPPRRGQNFAAYDVRLRHNRHTHVRTLCAEWFTARNL